MRLLLVLLALFTGIAHANIGSITEFNGSAVIKRGKETITAAKGTTIEQNDKIETKNGKIKIVFKDETTVSITEHSSLVIDDFVYDPKSGKGNLGMKATSGTVRYVSGALAKDPKQVKINTPTAAIAVRGTDFVMSVNEETGGSMVILMPTCDWETSAVKGLVCGSGAIDVQSGANIVNLTRPFQATLVETSGQPPTPPITVNLFNTPVGNNLQIAPPRTTAGANVITAARAAAAATGVPGVRRDNKAGKEDKEDKEDKDDAKDNEKQAVTAKSEGSGGKGYKQGRSANEGDENLETATKLGVDTAGNKDALASEVSGVSDTENPNLKKLWKDKSETQQIGWGFESLSQNNRNYALVTLPMGTQVQVTVTQDMQTNSWNFAPGKPQGQIVINQNFR